MKAGDSFIFRAVGSFLFFVINVFAFYLLLRGHNLPGGGFIAGLGSALSLIMLSLALGVERTQRILRVDPTRVAAVGLLVAVATALLPVLVGAPVLRQYNWKFEGVPVIGIVNFGTPLIFDLGVYLVVVGVSVKMIFVLMRSHAGVTALDAREWARYAGRDEEPVEHADERAQNDGTREDRP